MAVDTRWPAIPLFILRAIQFLFGLIVLGLSGNLIDRLASGYWSLGMTLSTALFTILYTGINVLLFTIGLLLPLPIVIVDAILLVLWLISFAGLGSDMSNAGYFDYQCSDFLFTEVVEICGIAKAGFALSILSFGLFIATLVIASIILHKNRKDLRGAKYNSGLNPNGELIDMERHGGSGTVPTHEAKPVVYQQHQPQFQPQQAAGVLYPQQEQQHIISPPQTPAPYAQQGYANAVSPPPPPPPPPPVNAQEMPGYHG